MNDLISMREAYAAVQEGTAASVSDWAKKGYVKFDVKNRYKKGQDVDFFMTGTGEKFYGKVTKVSDTELKIKPHKPSKAPVQTYTAKHSLPESVSLEEQLYHVTWGGKGVSVEVSAKNDKEAVTKAKAAILKRTPKLADEKYADTWQKKPRIYKV